MTSTDIIQYTPNKKDIEAMAVRDVGILIEDGFSDAAAELIMAMRLKTYFATRRYGPMHWPSFGKIAQRP